MVAGLIAAVAGWRAVFVVAAALMLVACVLVRTLPVHPPAVTMSYGQLLGSVVAIIREEPVLRLRMVYGMATYASFGVFWTSIGFMLAGGIYGWSDGQIGLFTLFGVAGALVAKVAGKLADRGYARSQTGVFIALTALSFLLLWIGQTQVALLAVGVALLDLGIQGTHISNQSVFYPLRPEARSRLNTAYMTSYFAAGSVGSVASAVVYGVWGWGAVCALGAVFPVIGTLVWLGEISRGRSARSADPRPRPAPERC